MRMIYGPSVLIMKDLDNATLTVGPSIPGPGRRLTITEHGTSLMVDLDDAAIERLFSALSAPLPMVDADTLALDEL